MEINFEEQCPLSEIENVAVPLENDVSLSFRPTQIPFRIEIIHASVTDESLFNLGEFLNTDFTDIVHATPGKIIYYVLGKCSPNHIENGNHMYVYETQ